MPRFQTKFEHDYEKVDSVWDWVNQSNVGYMRFTFGNLPDGCYDFCMEQLRRFRVPPGEYLDGVVTVGGSATFYVLDVVEPYAMFHGVSDVDVTGEWANTTYKIFDPRAPDRSSSEPNSPEDIESFSYVPGQAEETFNSLINNPGLNIIPNNTGEVIRDVLGGYHGETGFHQLTTEHQIEIDRVCTTAERGVDETQRDLIFELAAWAAYVWLVGPLGRDYRINHHDIMNAAIIDGECIAYNYMIIPARYYTKIDRPPMSCRCGVQVWCVESTQVGNHRGFICEACLNYDMPKSSYATCGTKFCMFTPCPNHPYHSYGTAGIAKAYNEKGQLVARVREQKQGLAGMPTNLLGG
jgi:hypothetical protein